MFFDIAGPDTSKLREFYSRLFEWDIGPDGRFSVTVATPLGGTLRQDPADKTLYVGVDDVTVKLTEVEQRGGRIEAPRFEVPGVVILGLCKDPCGNRIGLVEMRDGKPRVP